MSIRIILIVYCLLWPPQGRRAIEGHSDPFFLNIWLRLYPVKGSSFTELELDRSRAIKIGLALVLVYVLGFGLSPLFFGFQLYSILAFGMLGFVGLVLLTLSLFLPGHKIKQPNLVEEILSKEPFNYGIYTKGPWMETLDEKGRRKNRKRGS
jgi:hypothetical protein